MSLTLNLVRARMRQVQTAVQAGSILAGRPGPIEYYDLFAADREQSSTLLGSAMLDSMMRG